MLVGPPGPWKRWEPLQNSKILIYKRVFIGQPFVSSPVSKYSCVFLTCVLQTCLSVCHDCGEWHRVIRRQGHRSASKEEVLVKECFTLSFNKPDNGSEIACKLPSSVKQITKTLKVLELGHMRKPISRWKELWYIPFRMLLYSWCSC